MKEFRHSAATPWIRGDRRKRHMTVHVRSFVLLLTLPLLLFLLIAYSYLLWGMHTISEGADKAKTTYLPSILDNHRIAVNLEVIRRNAAIISLESDPEKRREARLAAQTLGTEITLNPDLQLDQTLHTILAQLSLLEAQCSAADEARRSAASRILEMQTLLQDMLHRCGSDTREAAGLMDIQAMPFILSLNTLTDVDQIQRMQDELTRRVDALVLTVPAEYRMETDRLRFLGSQALSDFAHTVVLREQASMYWETLDTRLRSLRDQLNIDAVDRTYATLMSIDSRISWMSGAAYGVCVFMILAFIALVALFHVYIVRPIILTSHKLQDIRTGKNSAPMPELRIEELNEVSTLINTASEQISLLYRHTRELEREKEQMENIAITDGLTGMYNRRYFDLQYSLLYEDALLKRKPLSVVMLDIDLFKVYNDTLGHSAGDECLIQVAQAIKAGLYRKTDMAFRYGGEEFVVLLPTCPNDMALALADRIRTHVQALGIVHPDSPVSSVVTVSVGVATLDPERPIDGKQLLDLADDAMYRAKSEGRNRVRSS